MTTYTMKLYDAAPQHKNKMRMSSIEKTLDFNLGPRDATFNKRAAWAAGDIVEAIGIRADQILMGLTVEVIQRTTTAANSGHKISVADANGNSLAYFLTGLEATVGKLTKNYDIFFQPVQFSGSDTLDVRINSAFTTGIVKIIAYVLEEDRS